MAGPTSKTSPAIAGLPADVSAAATHDLKRRFGKLAFLAGAVEEGRSFDGIHVAVDVHSSDGDAITYSLDGEIRMYERVRFDLLSAAVEFEAAPSIG